MFIWEQWFGLMDHAINRINAEADCLSLDVVLLDGAVEVLLIWLRVVLLEVRKSGIHAASWSW